MSRILVYGSKGGSGKTTASTVLSIGLQLPLWDLDPQKSATRWLARRQPAHPIVTSDADRWVADCPPGISGKHIGPLGKADLVLIPVRPAYNDLEVFPETVRFVEANSPRRVAFLLSAVDCRTSDEAMLRDLLRPFQHPVVGMFSQRVAYCRAGITGSLPGELDATANREMQTLITAVKELIQ